MLEILLLLLLPHTCNIHHGRSAFSLATQAAAANGQLPRPLLSIPIANDTTASYRLPALSIPSVSQQSSLRFTRNGYWSFVQ